MTWVCPSFIITYTVRDRKEEAFSSEAEWKQAFPPAFAATRERRRSVQKRQGETKTFLEVAPPFVDVADEGHIYHRRTRVRRVRCAIKENIDAEVRQTVAGMPTYCARTTRGEAHYKQGREGGREVVKILHL